ncbi:RNA polymerase factor sigma-54 [Arthrobacter sp. SAFR-044]|uniref:RNA polymerase factor sigma-54 n=1 Tax=Arthrobacter sp. SAFR-044 TaxID=3387278 RepID=UPI003F7C9132
MATEGPGPGLQLQAGLQPELRALPGLLRALGMLAMTHADVVLATERALADNPVLERAEGHPCPGCGRHVASGTCFRCRGTSGASPFHDGPEPAVNPFASLEADAAVEVRPDCRRALELVLAHLTSRGLLDCEPEQIALLHGLSPDQVHEALRAIRAVGPPGIACTSVVELLAIQAEGLVDAGEAPDWLPRLVRGHLADLAAGSTAAVVRAMGLSEEQVLAGLAMVRERLRPFVAVETSAAAAGVPTADVFLYRRADGSVEVEVPASAWFGLQVVDLSAGLPAASEAKQWLTDHELAARRLLYQIDRRAGALLRITECAVTHQKDFLDHGAGQHRPLTRTAVAQEIGLHPSTVSRAVSGKRLRLPSGAVIDLACLFGKGLAARAALQESIAAGGAASDEQLRAELARNGFTIARRTVNKYRRSLPLDA